MSNKNKLTLKKLLKNPVLVSSFFLTLTANLASLINFLANYFLVKAFSVPMYGEYTSAITYVALFSIPFSIISLIVISKIGKQKAEIRKAYLRELESKIKSTVKHYAVSIIVLMIAIFCFSFYWGHLNSYLSAVYIVLSLLVGAMNTIYAAYLQGDKKFRKYSLVLIIVSVVKLGGFAIVLWIGAGLTGIYSALIISTILGVIWQRRLCFTGKDTKKSNDEIVLSDSTSQTCNVSELNVLTVNCESVASVKSLDLIQFISQKSVWLPALSMLGAMSLISADMILVKRFLSADEAGIYGVISLFAKTINYALLPITQVVFAFGAGGGTNKTARKSRDNNLVKTLFFFLFFGLIATLAYALIPEFLIDLVAKKDYLMISPLLWMTALFGIFYSITLLLTQYFINLNSKWALISLFFAIIQIILIVLFHQSYALILGINVWMCGLTALIYTMIFWIKKSSDEKGKSKVTS